MTITWTKGLLAGAAIVALSVAAPIARADDTVEIVHWWTSGGEAAALNVIKQAAEKNGVKWVENPIAGGGGGQAMTVLRARVTSGNIPTAVQMLGFDIQDWAEQGVLADLTPQAKAGNWDAVVPKALQNFSKYDGKWVSVPVNVHSTNWVWGNKAVLEKIGVTGPINSWDDFVAALDKAKAAGVTPLAHGGQAWQEATVFDSVVLSTGGPDFYKKALIDLDPAALASPTMKKVFERMAKLRTYVDANFSGRDWNLATAMVIKGDAAFQIMGDWAKGEFAAAHKTAGKDFTCQRFPGTQGAVTFNSDQFVAFKVAADRQAAQVKLVNTVMDPATQSAFNVLKGSVPARTDVSDAAFDECGKKGMADLKEANTKGTLLGSLAHGHAARAAVKLAMYDVITKQFNGQITTDAAPAELAKAVAAAK